MNIKNALAVFFLCLLAACASSETGKVKESVPPEGERLISRGDDNLLTGNTLEAKRRYELALMRFQRTDDLKNLAATHLKLAAVCLVRNEIENARENIHAAKIIVEKENLGDLKTGLAVGESSVLIATGASADAIELLQTALQKAPAGDGPRLSIALGRAFLAANDLSESKKHFERALSAGKGGPFESAARADLGNALYKMNDLKGALAQLQAALALDKEGGASLALGDTLHMIGMVYEAENDYANAAYYYRRALSVNLQTDLLEKPKADRAAILRVEGR